MSVPGATAGKSAGVQSQLSSKASSRASPASNEQGAYAQWTDTTPITRTNLAPAIVGVDLAVDWPTVEPADGVFDWSLIDTRLQEAAAANLKVVLDLHTSPTAAPSWLLSNPQVQTITLLDTNSNHATACQNLTGPVFWDPVFLQKKTAFITAAGNRYASNPLVVATNVSFANWYTSDWSVPAFVGPCADCGGVVLNQVQQWLSAGYTTQNMISAAEQTITTAALAFPNQALKLPVHGTSASLDGTFTTLANTILNYGFTLYPTRFIAQIDFLSTQSPLANSAAVNTASTNTENFLFQLLNQYSPDVGFQMVAPATDTSGSCRLNGGMSPCPPGPTLQTAISVGSTYSPSFIEFANEDATNPTLTGVIQVPIPQVHVVATGADAGGAPIVRVFNMATGAVKFNFDAFNSGFLGGVRIALANVDGDGTPDIIAAPGPGGGPFVAVFDGQTGDPLTGPLGFFAAYDIHFLGGVFIAAGDVNGDGLTDIITGADAGGGPEVKVFSGKDGSILYDFYAYDPRFQGGVRVAAGDVNGDGKADIITAPGPSGGPDVRVYSGATGALINEFMAYNSGFLGGVYVAAGYTAGSGHANIITGAGPGGGPHVEVFDGLSLSVLQSFMAYDPSFTGGVRVAARDTVGDGKADIVTGAGPGGGPEVRIFDDGSSLLLDDFFAYPTTFLGGVYVG
jgi:hypothetical protein